MSKVLDKAFLDSVFPPERTKAFFDALFAVLRKAPMTSCWSAAPKEKERRNWLLSCTSVPENVLPAI